MNGCSITIYRAGDNGGGGGGGGGRRSTSLFCVAKSKNGDKSKKEKVSKQKLLKGCHQGQNIIVLTIIECLEFGNFSCWPTMADSTFQCSMAPPLWNPFRQPWYKSLFNHYMNLSFNHYMIYNSNFALFFCHLIFILIYHNCSFT